MPVGQGSPRAFECVAHVAGTFLKSRAGNLFRVSARVRESNRDRERTRPDTDLRAHSDVAGTRSLVGGGQISVAVVQVDL